MVILAGCGRSGRLLAPVEGTVTLDGKPLAGARLEFQPTVADGSPSYGSTDEEGHYELLYTQEKKGAMIGEHSVRIITRNENERVTERLPRKYHDEAELKRKVIEGKTNTFNFELELGEE